MRWHGLARRVLKVFLGVGIRIKIMGIVLGLIFLLGGGMMFQLQFTLADALGEQLDQRAISISSDLAARSVDYVLTNNTLALYELVRDTMANNQDVRYVFILDRNEKLLAHTFGVRFPRGVLAANSVPLGERYNLEFLETEEGIIRDVAMPIFDGLAGVARVGLREDALQKALAVSRQRLLLITAMVSLAGMVAAYLLTAVLTRPLHELVQVTKAVASGDLQQKAGIMARDEIGLLSEAFNAMTDNLARSSRDKARLLEKVISVQEEERKRIARELHDQTSQYLTSLLWGLRSLEDEADSPLLKEKIGSLRTMLTTTLEEVRNLALELRPSVLDDLGLVAALERYIQDFGEKTGLDVDLHVQGMEGRRLRPEVETTLYRIVQEALTNVAKHAQASNVSVLLEYRGETVMAMVEDDGQGFDVGEITGLSLREKRLGLYGMQERASLIGGVLTVESEPGVGTTVRVKVPVAAEGGASEIGREDQAAVGGRPRGGTFGIGSAPERS